ncbi:biotin/lipoyl-containing protein [Rasiella sp. SM2506]|uniref:biotin/lipoyl-containing protein n=1 Tax=Rasiella sp. SM2506 TaxID=3423914 RepID=UPI003D792100
MEEKFKVIVNQSLEFSLLKSDAEQLDIVTDRNTIHVVDAATSHHVEVLEHDFQNKTYTLKVNGNRFSIKIENELDFLIAEMGLSLGADSFENKIHAPMPGLILEVHVSPGQEIKANEPLCVLEAMKMENSLLAPSDGIVKAVHVKTGETVEKGVLLIELEGE